jgi:prepilin-type N-terminal cleavage/methylation domain-containing protein
MQMTDYQSRLREKIAGNRYGFTLVELLITMAVSAVVLTGVISVFAHMQHSSAQQVATGTLQQNQRGALAIMERELRLIGMNRSQSGDFLVTDVRKYSITEPSSDAVPDANGSPVLRMQVDLNNDGNLDADETITYSLFDRDNDGVPPWELSRSEVMPGNNAISTPVMVAEGVEAFGLAFAFDADNDGKIDRDTATAGEPIFWGVDTDNDNALDSYIDANWNLVAIGQNVSPDRIRGVQFWLLGRTQREDLKYLDNDTYRVGDQTIQPGTPPGTGDHFRRWLLSETIHCRNL